MNRLDNGDSSIGKARVVRGGEDLTIVTWGAMVHVALDAAENVSNRGVEVEVVDLRTLVPFDSGDMYQLGSQDWQTNRSTRVAVDWWFWPYSLEQNYRRGILEVRNPSRSDWSVGYSCSFLSNTRGPYYTKCRSCFQAYRESMCKMKFNEMSGKE